MVSLVDIVPQRRTVTINGGSELELRGLGLRQISSLLLRFPELRNLFANGAPSLDFDTIVIAAPDAIGSIIAESAGQPDAADNIADALSLDDLAECLIAVRDLTMPQGVLPFMDRLEKLLGADASAHLVGKGPGTTTPLPPSS